MVGQRRRERGIEQDGKHEEFARPVLVIRKFSRELFLGVPLCSQLKTHPYYHRITFKGREQAALLMQVRAWSSRRLINAKGKLAPLEFGRVREALRAML